MADPKVINYAGEQKIYNKEKVDELLNEMKQTKVETLSNVHCTRFINLPIATIQVDNDNKSLNTGDTVATVLSSYLPKSPVDFVMTSEQIVESVSKTFLLMLRLDTTGNISVINMVELADGAAATDTASVTYITRE